MDWDAVVAGRDKWQRTLNESLRPLGDRLMDLAEVRPGMCVLDVGTGTGEPALSAARRVHPGGSVLGIDTSSEMISVARRRATELQVKNAAFEVFDAQQLDMEDRLFDCVLCQLVLMFLPDPAGALAGMRAVLAPGGKIAVAVLGPIETTPMVSIWARAFGDPPPDQGRKPLSEAPGGEALDHDPFRFADQCDLERALVQAGFAEVKTESVTTELSFPSFGHYTDFQMDLRPDLCEDLRAQSADSRAATLRRAREAARPFTGPDGSLKISTSTNLASGRRP